MILSHLASGERRPTVRLSDLIANGCEQLRTAANTKQHCANMTPTSRPPELNVNPSLRIREKLNQNSINPKCKLQNPKFQNSKSKISNSKSNPLSGPSASRTQPCGWGPKSKTPQRSKIKYAKSKIQKYPPPPFLRVRG